MQTIRLFAAIGLLAAGLFGIPQTARAAQSYDNCSGFIDTLPATISTQGVWCLRADLATAITSGGAIEITTNNVTIDCNDFKIGGLAAGPASGAYGVRAINRQNATVRHCNIRGFHYGIDLSGGAGHLVEDNRLDNNLYMGIYISGENSLVQRNRVFDTGGMTAGVTAYGIYAYADIVDNIVDGVFTDGATTQVTGIRIYLKGTRAKGNRVGGLTLKNGGEARGIDAWGTNQTIAGNQVSATASGIGGYGIYGNANKTLCMGNTVTDFTQAMGACVDAGGNASL